MMQWDMYEFERKENHNSYFLLAKKAQREISERSNYDFNEKYKNS